MRYDELLMRTSRKRRLIFQSDGSEPTTGSLVSASLQHLRKMLKEKLGEEPNDAVLHNLYFGPIEDIIESGVRDPAEAAKRAFDGTQFDIEPSLNGVLLAYARYRGIAGASPSEILDYMTKTLEVLSPGILDEVQSAIKKAMDSGLPEHTKAAAAVALAANVLERSDLTSSWFSYEAKKSLMGRWEPEWRSAEEWASHLNQWWHAELHRPSEDEGETACGAWERPAVPAG